MRGYNFCADSQSVSDVVVRFAASLFLVFATPANKASFTALLKAFLDRYPTNGLAGVVAFSVDAGESMVHSMFATPVLSLTLVELGAIAPGRDYTCRWMSIRSWIG